MNDTQALALCVTCLLDNATQEATWSDFQVEWNPIITALTCKILLSCGLQIGTEWYVNSSSSSGCTLSRSLRWLSNAIRPDGTFGTDFWDAAQLAIVVEEFELHDWLPAYPSLKQHLLQSIRSREFASDESQWQGPGFWATAIEYLRLIKRVDDAHALSSELAGARRSDGCWVGTMDPHGTPIISPVWHTSQCIIALARDPAWQDAVRTGISWLKRTQDASGAWISVQQYKIYFTGYAILALLHEDPSEPVALRKAIDYLKSQMSLDGKCSDLGGTVMCALALRAVVGTNFEKEITLVDYLLARKNLAKTHVLEAAVAKQSTELSVVRNELAQYEKKFGDADFAISKKTLFLLVLLALFLTVVGTVVGVYALNAVLKPSTEQSIPQRTTVPPSDGSTSSLPRPAGTTSGDWEHK